MIDREEEPRPTRTDGAVSATAGLFTTCKLQALLDTGLAPGVHNRRTLTAVLRAAGVNISRHAIDAWFKHRDANYAFERLSLEPLWRSYAIPARHTPLLMRIFDLVDADLAVGDEAFRGHSEQLLRARQRVAAEAGRCQVFVCGSPADAETVCADLHWLTGEGFALRSAAFVPGSDSDWPLLRRLEAADVVLFGLSARSATDATCHEVLELAVASQLPTVVVRLDANAAVPPACAQAPVLPPPAQDAGRRRALAMALRQHARGVRDRTAPVTSVAAWPPQPLVSDRPSIAVLPFLNLSGDTAVDALADGLSEGIITLLSRVPELFVIAHSTTRAYARLRPDRRAVRQQLGVRYVLEGTLRSDGQHLRATAQLVDTGTGSGVWAERFDSPLDNLFSVQDELTLRICGELEPRLRLDDIDFGSRTGDVRSWRLWAEGWYLLFVDAPAPVQERSLTLFRQALDLEPDYALAHAGIAAALSAGMMWGGLSFAHLETARRHVEIACKRSPENPVVLYALAMTKLIAQGNLRAPLDDVRRAVELEPGNPVYLALYGYLEAMLGNAQQGMDRCMRAMRLSPRDARKPFLAYMLGNACIANGQYAQAIETMLGSRSYSEVDYMWLAMAFASFQMGNESAAIDSLRSIRRPRPYRIYERMVMEFLWMNIPETRKQEFLALFAAAGLVREAVVPQV